jgi:excisionase family DNA binding protein
MTRLARLTTDDKISRGTLTVDPMLTLAESALACGCSTSTMRKRVKKNLLPFFQIGTTGHIKIRKSALEKFLHQQTHQAEVSNAS